MLPINTLVLKVIYSEVISIKAYTVWRMRARFSLRAACS